MEIRKTPLISGNCYHIFNRGINGMPVFFEDKNYHYFLQQYTKYVHPLVETFAYCLLGNHFHLFIRVRSKEELDLHIKKDHEKPHYWHVSNGFSSFLQSYTRAMNKMYDRTGALFETPFKRIEVSNDSYFSALIAYIHRNPETHGVVDDFREYPCSSYHAMLQEKTTRINRKEVMEWFGNGASFVKFHKREGFRELEADWLLE
tara:strand:- start:474 stop:1082 length:609 start_codon:yes stop_codon:yes gene_type:complete